MNKLTHLKFTNSKLRLSSKTNSFINNHNINMELVVVVPSTHPIESCGVPSTTKTYQALQIGEAVTFRKMGEASQPPQTSLVKTKNKGGMLVGVHQI